MIRETGSSHTIEEIGKIKLNLKHYPGEDFYCDGEVEDELLQIVQDYSEEEFAGIIEDKKSWPILYHLSFLRENIVEWLPITGDMKVLEVGSGCGAITGALARKAKEVTCIDLSKKRSMINAYRHKECDNIMIHVGNFQDVEPDLPCDFDYICLIGVFEYGQAYIQSDTPYEDFLHIIRKHCKADGHIVIAIENKLGLKYWAGCREDHLGSYFSGIEDYPDGGVVRTFTAEGLKKIAVKSGFNDIQMFYPYPDYKFMTGIYSDAYLPKVGELSNNIRNFDRDRIMLFDEKKVFDTLIREGQFPLFSNSYMMVLGPAIATEYVKYSNDRALAFRIRTQKKGNGFQKIALSKKAVKHLEKTYDAYRKLESRYEGSKLCVNRCELIKDENDSSCLQFETVSGITLEEIMDYCLEKERPDAFQSLLAEYLERISFGQEAQITDYDLIFANILVETDRESLEREDFVLSVKNARWTIIDYEWTFEKAYDAKEIAFRALHCYLLENEKRNRPDVTALIEKLSVTPAQAEMYRRKEKEFQEYVTGKRMSMAQLCEAIGNPVYTLDSFVNGQEKGQHKDRIQIYEDTGAGFCEEQSFFLEDACRCICDECGEDNGGHQVTVDEKGMTRIRVTIGEERRALRIDPLNSTCLVFLKEITWNGKMVPLRGKHLSHNGVKVGENLYAFDTVDPNITLSLSSFSGRKKEDMQECNILRMTMEITKVSSEVLKRMQKRGLF